MELQERIYDIDDVWELAHHPDNEDKRFELIDGVLIEMSPPGGRHGQLAIRLGHYLYTFAESHSLGVVTAETGYHPPDDRLTLLAPDVAFVSYSRAQRQLPDKYVPLMPDLAVEILSPSETMTEVRLKAQSYLRNGAQLVWIVMPSKQVVEVHRAETDSAVHVEILGVGDTLSGEHVLPGFSLDARLIFE